MQIDVSGHGHLGRRYSVMSAAKWPWLSGRYSGRFSVMSVAKWPSVFWPRDVGGQMIKQFGHLVAIAAKWPWPPTSRYSGHYSGEVAMAADITCLILIDSVCVPLEM